MCQELYLAQESKLVNGLRVSSELYMMSESQVVNGLRVSNEFINMV